jgi:hypothetical protein
MSDIQVGDKVRVTFEGVVSSADVTGFALGGRYFGNGVQAERTVEVLEKRPAQVGDVIASREDLANLPENSVVTNALGRPIIVRSHGTVNRHGDVDGFSYLEGTPPYKVVHVGE